MVISSTMLRLRFRLYGDERPINHRNSGWRCRQFCSSEGIRFFERLVAAPVSVIHVHAALTGTGDHLQNELLFVRLLSHLCSSLNRFNWTSTIPNCLQDRQYRCNALVVRRRRNNADRSSGDPCRLRHPKNKCLYLFYWRVTHVTIPGAIQITLNVHGHGRAQCYN